MGKRCLLRAAAIAALVIAVAGGAFAATTVTVTSPNGGENWSAGTKHNITWTSNSPTEVRIELYTVCSKVNTTTEHLP